MALGFEKFRPLCVARGELCVLTAVDLDYELQFVIGKINNVTAKMHLPAKMRGR